MTPSRLTRAVTACCAALTAMVLQGAVDAPTAVHAAATPPQSHATASMSGVGLRALVPRLAMADARARHPSPPGTSAGSTDPIAGLSFVDPQHGWAVGSDATGAAEVLATANQGTTWTRLSLPQAHQLDNLTDVHFTDLTHGWVVGATLSGLGVVLATADGGQTWTAQTLPTGVAFLNAVWFTDSSHGWAGGVSSGQTGSSVMIATTDGGATWVSQTLPGASTVVYSVDFVGLRGWAVTDTFSSGGAPGIVTTQNGGSLWTQQTVPSGVSFLTSVSFSDANTGWAGGFAVNSGTGTASGVILSTTNGGAAWSQQTLPAGSGPVLAVRAMSPTNVWAAGWDPSVTAGQMWAGNGTAWALQPVPPGASLLQSVQPVGPNQAFAGGAGACSNASIVFANNGNAVEQLDQSPHQSAYFNGLSAQSASNVLAVGGDQCGNGVVVRTANGGGTWTHTSYTGLYSPPSAVSFPTAGNAWIVGPGNVIEMSSDGGQTWQLQTAPSVPSSLSAVQFLDQNNGFAAGLAIGVGGAVIQTSDGGTTWASLPTPPGSSFINGISFSSPTAGIVVGQNTSMQPAWWTTTDGGQTWTAGSIATAGAFIAAGTAPQNANDIWVVGAAPGPNYGALIYSSQDGGTTFTQQAAPPGVIYLDSVSVLGANTAYAGGVAGGPPNYAGAIIATSNAGSTWTSQPLPNGTGPLGDLTFAPGTTHGFAGDPGAVGTHIVATTDGSTWTNQVVPSLFGGQFRSLAPTRILDTRPSTNLGTCSPGCTTLGPNSSIDITVTGGGVPAGAAGVALNVTVVPPAGSPGSFLTVYPTGVAGGRPLASNLNYANGQIVANLVDVAIGSGGKVTAYNASGSADVIFDLAGFYTSTVGGEPGIYHALAPARLLDTRAGSGTCLPAGCAAVGPGGTITLQVTGAGGVPSTGVASVVFNLTATDATGAPSFLTAYPSDQARPVVSNLNFVPGQTVPNRVAVKVSTTGSTPGQVSIYNNAGSVDVIVDINGWYADSTGTDNSTGAYIPLSPARVLDTRAGSQTGRCASACTTVGPHGTLNLTVAGAGGVTSLSSTVSPTAVVLNVTVTNTTAGSFLTVYPGPAGTGAPVISDLNYGAGSTIPNLVVVKLGTDGTVNFFNNGGAADLVVDVVGFYD